MRNQAPGQDPLPARLKHFIVDTLRLRNVKADQITDDEPLLGGGLGLDSLDALELAMRLEEEYGVTIHSRDESHAAFASIASLTSFIQARGCTSHPSTLRPVAGRNLRQVLTSPAPG